MLLKMGIKYTDHITNENARQMTIAQTAEYKEILATVKKKALVVRAWSNSLRSI